MEKMLKTLTLSKSDYDYMYLIIKCELRNYAQLTFQLILKFSPPVFPTSFIILKCTLFLPVFEISAASIDDYAKDGGPGVV